jgi:membrane protein required for colicin V production
MALYDIIMLAVLVLAVLFGAWKGMAWQLASLASLVLSYMLALQFSGQVAPLLSIDPPLNHFVAMLIIYAVTSLVVWLVFRMVADAIDRVRLKEFDRQMGALFGAAKGVLFCVAITFFAVTLSEKSRGMVREARSGLYIAHLIDRADAAMPEDLHQHVGPILHRLEERLDEDGPGDRPAEGYHGLQPHAAEIQGAG